MPQTSDDQALHALAAEIGVSRIWHDAQGEERTVGDASLVAIAEALGYGARTPGEIAASRDRVRREQAEPPAMLVTEAGTPTHLPPGLAPTGTSTLQAELTAPDGTVRVFDLSTPMLPALNEPGYYALKVSGRALTLAVAPREGSASGLPGEARIWGPAVQIGALRAEGSHPFGTFRELAEAVDAFAAQGADVIAINPVHALFAGVGEGFSPYSPSSRLCFNGALGDPALLGLPLLPQDASDGEFGSELGAGSEGSLIDWEAALPRRLVQLRAYFSALDEKTRARISRDNARHGEKLVRQALYDALDVHFRSQGLEGWQVWPEEFRDPGSAAVAAFALEHDDEIAFHLFTQWLARESLAAVQARARAGGMAVGLLADLAVGVHTQGADAWSMGDSLLQGLTIGAPPDPMGPLGQNWMLTSFSPQGLARSGYAPWIETIRAALRTSGALRVDHAFGLARLWVVPGGKPSSEGAYLAYPFADLVRILALEAHLAGALIVAEDLGTMPQGFGPAIAARGILGMRVLWFERSGDGGFLGASQYDAAAVAMTGTHDTATIAGWWSGRDLDWAEKLGRLPEGLSRQEAEERRDRERNLLWTALTHDAGPPPPADEPEAVVEAALRHIGRTPCALAVAPLEDLLAAREQPNLPGTVTEHPNWRRRLSAPLPALLAEPATARRLQALNEARRQS
ncbi:4-alpha-glucanotransferase [Novosphingobium sp. FGD1]|uniref:4-alpha-glucanotransferase n=2 Tax=Novosphingobium silvae TaxID=2692619 RepID=A0A7X4GGH7_9SPHN|nr:4-alpha-glucanotransferase [Novosphingobium silvae]MYL98216.1 4-alpha-glucanotransferase [Novosphingobium silvae]